jgi:hypothetical protein
MTQTTILPMSETLDQTVDRLLKSWRAETAYLSSSSQVTAHAAYREIIALGATALPFLFKDLARTHDGHLSKALTAITGSHPIEPKDRGQIRRVAEVWLEWALEHGYQW